MARKFQILRGPASRLPVLAQAEPAMTTDAGAEKVLIGTGSGNLELALQRDLNDHAGDGGKHITAAERTNWNGKAQSVHKHSAEDINAGTLPVVRGGTGVTSVGGTDYTSVRFRGSGLVSAETAPSVNGTINWTYE